MKREFRDRWLEACTNGRFTSISGELINPADHRQRCCLSVAHAVAKEMGIITSELYYQNENDEGYLTDEDAKLIGITDQGPFANANDHWPVVDGDYYPQQVLDLIKEQPTVD